MGEYDKAVIDYTAAIQSNPEFAQAFYNRGVAYCGRANSTRPWPTLLPPSGSTLTTPRHSWRRGRLYEKQGEKSKAEEDFAQAKKLGYEPK